MAEFQANALSLVGNFSGPCIIYLNGEAITVKQDNGVEIAKWPYNCIRQFKAEDDTGKFSFVSGRRGPYGVAEYNFGLDDVGELQHALSQFTGAQFSQAPSGQQQQQPVVQQPPLPPLPPGHHTPYVHGQRPSSISSVGRHSIGMGGRTDSIDSVFMSPGHMRSHAPSIPGPRLPPRDYSHTPSGSSGSGSFVGDSLISPGGGYASTRTRNSASTGDLLESNLSSSSPQISSRSCVPQPSLGGSSYPSSNGHSRHQQLSGEKSPQAKTKADGSRARKSSPGTPRRSPLTQPAAPPSSESRDEVPDLPPRESRPKTNSTGSIPTLSQPGSTSSTKLKKQHTEPSIPQKSSSPSKPAVTPKPTIAPKPATSPKPSHSQQNKLHQKKKEPVPPLDGQSPSPAPEKLSHQAGKSEEDSTSVTPEPAGTSGTTSPVPDSTDLDHIPRSSPTVSRNRRPTLRGRQSPNGKLTRSTTVPGLSSETYDTPKPLQTQLSADGGETLYNNVSILGENQLESDDTYQVPRPTVSSEYHVPRPQDDVMNEQRHYQHPKPADEIYKVPVSRPMSGTYSSLLGHTPENVYSNPRPTRSPQGVYYSYPPEADSDTMTAQGSQVSVSSAPDGQLYSNVTLGTVGEAPGETEENFYNVPRPGVERQESQDQQQTRSEQGEGVADGLYNIPRSLSNEQQDQAPSTEEGLYKMPKASTKGSSDQDRLYMVPPRSVKQSGSESPPPRNPYETVDFDEPRKLRPARSLESLQVHRVQTPPPGGQANRYVGLNVDNPSGHPVPTGWIQKQPLPPRPQQASNPVDNVYAEIPEDLLAKHRMANGRWSPPARGEKTFDNLYVAGPDVADSTLQPNRSLSPYDKLPPARRPTPEDVASEGVAKAKELAKQGYELCLPSGEDPRTSAPRTPPISTPPRNIPRKNFDMYDIKVPRDLRSKRSLSSSMAASLPTSEGNFSTSIPSDSTNPNADEYVIITRSDTRLKYTQTLPKSTSTGQMQPADSGSIVPLPEGDEYELMNPVKSQILLSQSVHYSTPNPSLYHNGSGVTTSTAAVMSTGVESGVVGGGASNLYGNVECTDIDFSDLDRVPRPAAYGSSGLPQFVRSRTLPSRRKTVSSSSTDSDVFVNASQNNVATGPESIPEEQKKYVRIATHDLGGTAELRLRSCSMDDILDNGAEKPKRHSYVNVKSDGSPVEPSSVEENENTSATLEPSQQGPPKKPKPFPRNSLLRMDSEEQK